MSKGAARVLVLAAALAAPAAAQDVLVTRDGQVRSGRLTSCVGGVCVFGGAKVARSEIAWLGLGETTPRPPASTQTAEDEVHLRIRQVVVAPVTGISLGVVATAARSFDRPEVAWIRFAGGAGTAPIDLIIRRAGGLERGKLQGCAADRCTLGGRSFTRGEIAWLGLQVTGETPPALADPARDEIHRRDGGIDPGPLVGIGGQNVVTQRDTYARAAVAWIYLALPADEPQPGAFGAPDDDDAETEETDTETEDTTKDEVPDPPEPPEPPTEEPPPPEDEPPPKDPPPVLPPPPGSGQRGALWTGSVVGICTGTSEDWVTQWSYRVDVRMREYRHTAPCPPSAADPQGKRIAWTYIDLEPEGSVIHNRLQMRTRDAQINCRGGDSVDVSTEPGEAGVGHGGGIYINSGRCKMQYSVGAESPPAGRGLYSEFVPPPHGAQFSYTCRGPDGSDTIESGYISPVFGGNPGLAQECGDPETRYLEADNGMMRGAYTARCTDGCQMHVSFSICREGVKCPPPEALPGKEPPQKDPCDKGPQADLRDNCYKQLDLLNEELNPHLAEYIELQNEAQGFAWAFDRADLECEIWDTVDTLLKAYIGGGAGKIGQAGKALLYLADVLEKVQEGELHTLLYPEWSEEYLEHFQQVKDAYASITDDELTKMQKRLESCSGKVGVETQIAAEKFLGLLQAAKRVWDSKVAPGLNDLRTKGLECAGWDHKAWQACIEEAECRGVPPDCGPEPSLDVP